MSLHVHRAERTDRLADGLAELLAVPAGDPFDEELVVVPAQGVERWLSQRLSHRLGAEAPAGDGYVARGDGVCAGVQFVSPRSLVAQLLEIVEDDAWAPDALVWPLLSVMDDSMDEPWFATLARHLGAGEEGDEAELRRGRRYAVAARLARLFNSYAVQRPALLDQWNRAGDDRGDVGSDGGLDEDLAWQPELWRRLSTSVPAVGPLERHRQTIERLHADPSSFSFPSRLSLFGHTRLPASEIELLTALAVHRDVHLWLPHPSRGLWSAEARGLELESEAIGASTGTIPRAEDQSHVWAHHPLLATLARDSRELQRALSVTDHEDHYLTALPINPKGPENPAGTSLLNWLQSDLRDNAVRPEGRTVADHDRSVQVHACHGPARQVEVLREVLLGLLESDSDLEPRDVLVMCPDIETYAPLITAGFGLGDVVADGHPGHQLRVRLADRALAQTNPLLGVASRLLDLAGGRMTASTVLDLAQADPVRRRFGFTDDDLERLSSWVRESGVRWGFDASHRETFGLNSIQQNTWQAGLDRVLSGVALSDDAQSWLGTTLPLDDVDSLSIDLAGRLAEFIDRLREVTDHLVGTHAVSHWVATLLGGVELLTAVPRDEAWQVGQARRELARVLDEADSHASTQLRLPDVRALLQSHLAGRPSRANFRTGTLTVCTMVPMRSVPHRVVCLLGMDDGIFPRHGLADGDDVLARRPMTGERDPRSEDRHLLLDAIHAATQTLVVTYTGANESSGQPRPPAVPLDELLDALDRTTEERLKGRVLVEHPLQSFDARNLIPGALKSVGPRVHGGEDAPKVPFTFDPTAVVAATAASGNRAARPPFVSGPLPLLTNAQSNSLANAMGPTDIDLVDLLRFFADPVKGFFSGLGITLPWEMERVADDMPVDLEALQRWGVGDRMLSDMLAGMHPDNALQTEWRRGTLPPGRLGWRDGLEVREKAMQLAIKALTHRQVPPGTYDIDVDLGNDRRLTGTVPRVYGGRLVSVTYSRLGAKQLLAAWIQLLALAASDEDHNYTALAIGTAPRGNSPAARLFSPPGAEAKPLLADLVAIRDEGLREPLPLPLKTSFAWASAVAFGGDPDREARNKWESRAFDGEDAAPAHVRVWGERAPLSELRPGLDSLSARVWEPMFRFEQGSA